VDHCLQSEKDKVQKVEDKNKPRGVWNVDYISFLSTFSDGMCHYYSLQLHKSASSRIFLLFTIFFLNPEENSYQKLSLLCLSFPSVSSRSSSLNFIPNRFQSPANLFPRACVAVTTISLIPTQTTRPNTLASDFQNMLENLDEISLYNNSVNIPAISTNY